MKGSGFLGCGWRSRGKGFLRKSARLWGLVLVACLLVSGCGKEKNGNTNGRADAVNGTVDGGGNGGNSADSGNGGEGADGGAGKGGGAYGRYVEEELPMPQGITDGSEALVSIMMDGEQRLSVYCTDKSGTGVARYVLGDGDTWQSAPEPWMEDPRFEAELTVSDVKRDEAGNLFVMTWEQGDNVLSHAFKVNAGESELIELELEGLNDIGGWFYKLFPDAGGNKVILLPAAFPSNAYTESVEEGKKLYEFNIMSNSMAWYNDQIVQVSEGGDKLVFIDGASGEQLESMMITDQEAEPYTYSDGGAIFAEGGKGIWLAREEGLMFRADGGSMWEILLEGDLSVLGMPEYSPTGLLRTGEDVFYISYTNYLDREGIVRICYQDDVQSAPTVTLSVYSLEDSASIRQAIVEFQRENPDVEVDYRAVMSENSSATKEDCIKALNTELLAGKGADLIVTDGLPLDSYVEKGVLVDLSAFAQEQAQQGNITENIVESAKQGGMVYSIPTRWVFPAALGSERARAATGSIEELARASAEAGTPFFGKGNYDYEELFESLFLLYGDEVTAGGQASRESIKAFLGAYLSLARESVVEEGESASGFGGVLSTINDKNGELGFEKLGGIQDWMIPNAALDNSGYSASSVRDSYFPVARMAINRSSQNVELAQRFLEKLLSEQVQSADLDGFPVNPAAVERLTMKKNEELYFAISYGDEDSEDEGVISAGWPSEERLHLILDNLNTLTTILDADETILEMFQNELPALWNGEKELDAAVEAIYQKLNTYLSE